MSDFKLPPLPQPAPLYEVPFQHGITDPMWPVKPPWTNPNPDHLELYDRYRGRVDPQGFLTLVRADVKATTCGQLQQIISALSWLAYEQMQRTPDASHTLPLEPARLPESYRVTVTIAFGSTLFLDRQGRDRFGLLGRIPRCLKVMPSLPGDQFDPLETATDLLIQICSDHPYVNSWITQLLQTGEWAKRLHVTSVQRGFARPDLREHLGFDDGIGNLRAADDDPLHRLVYIDAEAAEPRWCVGGCYLVYRKIREDVSHWESLPIESQERTIGRKKGDGQPLAKHRDPANALLPDYQGDPQGDVTPLAAHIRKVQPRRAQPDFCGVDDLDRRFHRRPYPFFGDLTNRHGRESTPELGLHFLAYMRSIREQFEHVATMWQFNPDFPNQGVGMDSLYAREILTTLDGGYYFCPPGITDPTDFVGSGLFHSL